VLKRVLLTHSNHVRSDAKQAARMQPYPPLQTLLAAAVLRERGMRVVFFDPALEATLDDVRTKFVAALEREEPELLVVCEDDFNFLTKMCLLHSRKLAFWMAQTAQAKCVPAVVHGSDATDHAALYLNTGYSAVLVGEAESSLLAYLAGSTTQSTVARSARMDLDSLPLPAWDLVDIERYRREWIAANGFFSLNMAASRGCPFRCNWCAKPVFGSNYRTRSPKSVAAEMSYLRNIYHPDQIWFADDIFALSARWTTEFADEICRLGAAIPFKMQSRCDLMTPNAADALRRAGCAEVWMGAESGSQRILNAMEKGSSVNDIYSARENLRNAGIRACFFLQFGYPGEEWAEIRETIRMVRETQPDDVGISVSYPLPGTRFHQIVAAQIGTQSNWSDSGDLSMMFQGAYSSDFYRALADAIHLEVRGNSAPHLVDAWSRVHDLLDSSRLAGVA
jgi:radical SAM superfamily enzyme YgiQ (UPF0313 family)